MSPAAERGAFVGEEVTAATAGRRGKCSATGRTGLGAEASHTAQ
ncbi:hypothetical protein [Mycobacterium kyorinense]|nr:hypothetical protein [Mycobacterium kyorinense]